MLTTATAKEEPPNTTATPPTSPAPTMAYPLPSLAHATQTAETHCMVRWSQYSSSSLSSDVSATLMTPDMSTCNLPADDVSFESNTAMKPGSEEPLAMTANEEASPQARGQGSPYNVGVDTISTRPTHTSMVQDDHLVAPIAELDAQSAPVTFYGEPDNEPAALEGDIEQSHPDPVALPLSAPSVESYNTASRPNPLILATDKPRGIVIHDLSANIPMPITRSSSWSGRSRHSLMEEEAMCPAWARPTIKRNSVGGTPEEIKRQADIIKVDFGEKVFELDSPASPDAAPALQHALKCNNGRVMVMTNDKQHVVYFWLPGIDQDACMISSGQGSVQVQASSHERDEHFSWRVEIADGKFGINPAASWDGPNILRIAIDRKKVLYDPLEPDPGLGNSAWHRLRMSVKNMDDLSKVTTREFIWWIWDKPTENGSRV